MNYANAREGSRQATGVAVAVLAHVVLIYALITGSALRVVETVREPFETRIIAETPAPLPEPLPAVAAPVRSRSVSAPVAPVATPAASAPQLPASEIPAGSAGETAIAMPSASAGQASGGAATVGRPAAGTPEVPAASVRLDGCAMPEYPSASIAAEESGTVALSFLVDIDGQVLESRVDRSSGHRRLDEAARRALGRCKFRPAYVDGKPRQAWAHINYVWRLE